MFGRKHNSATPRRTSCFLGAMKKASQHIIARMQTQYEDGDVTYVLDRVMLRRQHCLELVIIVADLQEFEPRLVLCG